MDKYLFSGKAIFSLTVIMFYALFGLLPVIGLLATHFLLLKLLESDK